MLAKPGALSLPLSTATRLVGFLVDNGYAQRMPDPDDRRIVRVALTDSGRQFYKVMGKHLTENVQRVLGSLTTEGIAIQCSRGPKAILVNNGRVAEVECMVFTAVLDAEGRFNPSFCKEEVSVIEGDTVILAVTNSIGKHGRRLGRN